VGADALSFKYDFLKTVFDWVVELREMGIYANLAFSNLYFALPERQSEVRAFLLTDLTSDDEVRVRTATQAIRALYGLANLKDISIESDLLDALVQKVVFRHDVGLHDAAQQVGFILMQFPNVLSDEAIILMCNSLAAWARATNYSDNGAVAGFVNSEKPKLQAVIATLAGALSVRLKKSKTLPNRSENVEMWRRISLGNCLPEVRRAYSNGVKYSSFGS
jgi:hypothetical protein